jgi:hypothetical protein
LGVLALGTAAVVAPLPASAANAQSSCNIEVNDDAYQTTIDTPLVVAEPGVVANDQICGTDGLVISTSSPSHGTLENFDDEDGGFTYTPDVGFTGTDSFTYVLEDVRDSPEATVTITVSSPETSTSSSSTSSTVASSSTSSSSTTATTATATATAAQAVSATPKFTG